MKFNALYCLTLLMLFACSNTLDSNATGKNNQKRDALRIQARASADLMLAGDYESYVKTLHPKIVKMMGGYQTTVDNLRDSTEKMKADGFNFLDISLDEPSKIINEGKEDVAVIPITMIVGSDSLKIKQSSYLVAISAIDSTQWFFMSGQGLSKERLKGIYPKLASSVEIPEIRNYVMDQDEEKAFSKYLSEKIKKVEKKEGKPFSQILDEKINQVEKSALPPK